MNSSDLIQQINEYIVELLKIEELITRQQSLQLHLQVLKQKITMKIGQFRMAAQQFGIKQHSPAIVDQMSHFFKESFTLVIKEAHRLIQIRSNPESQERLKGKVSIIKEMEDEMGSIWDEKGSANSDGVMKRLNENVSMLTEQLGQCQLRSIAKDYLHKQFLAIRMIAYKLYQQYVGHSHLTIKKRLQEVRQAQEQLFVEAGELRDVNKELKSEQKRIVRELNQLKKVNDLIGKRYFVPEDKISPKRQ